MRWGNDLLDLAERFHQVEKIEQGWPILREAFSQFGGTDAGYGFCWREHGVIEEALRHFDYPRDFLDRYEEAGHVHHDFAVLHCMREPEAHSVTTDRQRQAQLTPRQLQVEHEAWDFGIRHLVMMPLRGEGLGWGGLAVAFRETTELEFQGVVSAHIEDVRRIGLMFHGAVRRQPGLGGLIELSPREREVLSWTAAGHSSKVIAHRLNLSTRTVEHHIASAQKRLGAHNRTHAVAKALVLNLIQP